MTNSDIVPTGNRAAEEEDAVPHSGVETVTGAGGETGVNALTFSDWLELTCTAEVSEQSDAALTVVRFKVNHKFPTCPFTSIIVEVNSQSVVWKNNAVDKHWARVIACSDKIYSAVL